MIIIYHNYYFANNGMLTYAVMLSRLPKIIYVDQYLRICCLILTNTTPTRIGGKSIKFEIYFKHSLKKVGI